MYIPLRAIFFERRHLSQSGVSAAPPYIFQEKVFWNKLNTGTLLYKYKRSENMKDISVVHVHVHVHVKHTKYMLYM